MELNLNIGDIYAITAALCWSSGVILFDMSGKTFDSAEINLLKNIFGFICFVITLIFTNSLIENYTYFEFGRLFISAILGVAIGDLFLLHSLRRLGAGLYAIVGTSYIMFIFFLAFLMFNEIVSLQVYLGGIMVVLGIILRSKNLPIAKNRKTIYIGVCFGLVAQFLTAYSVLLVRPIMSNHSIIHIAMIRFGIGVFFNFFHMICFRGIQSVTNTIYKGIMTPKIIIGAFLGTFLSVLFWLGGFKYTLAGRAAIYNQLSTILITVMAAIFLKEKLNLKSYIAVVLAFCGAIIVSISN